MSFAIHGRSRQQRYRKSADWSYIHTVSKNDENEDLDISLIGNGDIYNYTDWNREMEKGTISSCLLARGALIKPWLCTEIKEQRYSHLLL